MIAVACLPASNLAVVAIEGKSSCLQAPLSQSTCINIASRYCEQRIADGEDAKCIRIQQLRETLISVASEKASLAEALSLCKENILQLEASASLPVRHMCQACSR